MNLNPGEVHIWSASIDERYIGLLTNSCLSENESKRARKFINDIDAVNFSIRHNLLRIILGKYLDSNPATIKFSNNRYLKPHIAHTNSNIQFNISCSANRFVAAFCVHNPIGVDIEQIRPIDEIKLLTKDYFTLNEAAYVYNQPDSLVESAFLSIWSKKEALIKAIGKGVSLQLSQFDVLSDNPINFGGDNWYITPITIFDDCATAFAINYPVNKISYFNASDLL